MSKKGNTKVTKTKEDKDLTIKRTKKLEKDQPLVTTPHYSPPYEDVTRRLLGGWER